MQEIKKVVVGFDHSEQAHAAFAFASALVGQTGQVRAVVAMDGWLPRGLSDQFFAPETEGAKIDLDARVIEDTRKVLSGLTNRPEAATIDIRHMPPARAINESAKDMHADLIVVGATGQGLVSKWLLGSTATRLIRYAKIPVLVHHPCLTWPAARITCATDFSPPSDAAMDAAVTLARKSGAQLSIFHANTGPSWGRTQRQLEIEHADAEDQAATRLATRHDVGEMTWTCRSATGTPDQAIVQDALDHREQLLCLGTVGRSGIQGVLVGNTAERVLRAMPCAILAVQAPTA
jgi:nucleotide-binding universal stress UspA family protein